MCCVIIIIKLSCRGCFCYMLPFCIIHIYSLRLIYNLFFWLLCNINGVCMINIFTVFLDTKSEFYSFFSLNSVIPDKTLVFLEITVFTTMMGIQKLVVSQLLFLYINLLKFCNPAHMQLWLNWMGV